MNIVYVKINSNFDLNTFLSILPEVGIIGDIYFFIDDFEKYFKHTFNAFKEVVKFLKEFTFYKINLHLVHPYINNLENFYNEFYQYLTPFNLEGFRHQVTPRLIIFPLIISPPLHDSTFNAFLEFTEFHFMPLGIIIKKNERPLNIERVFLFSHSDPLLSVGYQNYLLNLLENVRLTEKDWYLCPSAIVIEGKNVFPCIRAYELRLNYIPLHFCFNCRYEMLTKFHELSLIDTNEITNIFFRLGLVYFENKEIEIADKHFSYILNLILPEDKEDVYYYLGLCKAQLGEYDLAIEYLKKANIFHYNTYFYIGFSYFQKGELLKAKENFEKALKFELPIEDKLFVTLYLAHVYKELKMYNEAISICEALTKIMSIKELHNLIGICYYKLKNYEKAVLHFKKVIELDPDSAIDYANLCLALKALNRLQEAKYFCEKALQLDPSIQFAKEALKEINKD